VNEQIDQVGMLILIGSAIPHLLRFHSTFTIPNFATVIYLFSARTRRLEGDRQIPVWGAWFVQAERVWITIATKGTKSTKGPGPTF